MKYPQRIAETPVADLVQTAIVKTEEGAWVVMYPQWRYYEGFTTFQHAVEAATMREYLAIIRDKAEKMEEERLAAEVVTGPVIV